MISSLKFLKLTDHQVPVGVIRRPSVGAFRILRQYIIPVCKSKSLFIALDHFLASIVISHQEARSAFPSYRRFPAVRFRAGAPGSSPRTPANQLSLSSKSRSNLLLRRPFRLRRKPRSDTLLITARRRRCRRFRSRCRCCRSRRCLRCCRCRRYCRLRCCRRRSSRSRRRLILLRSARRSTLRTV